MMRSQGEWQTQRSTTGGHLCIAAPISHCPTFARFKPQDSTAASTSAAERDASYTVLETSPILALGMWGVCLRKPKQFDALNADNAAAILAQRSGIDPTIQHLHRVQGVNISSCHELADRPLYRNTCTVVLTPGCEMRAYIFTQAILCSAELHHA